jgi:uncharacterized protein YwgA
MIHKHLEFLKSNIYSNNYRTIVEKNESFLNKLTTYYYINKNYSVIEQEYKKHNVQYGGGVYETISESIKNIKDKINEWTGSTKIMINTLQTVRSRLNNSDIDSEKVKNQIDEIIETLRKYTDDVSKPKSETIEAPKNKAGKEPTQQLIRQQNSLTTQQQTQRFSIIGKKSSLIQPQPQPQPQPQQQPQPQP